MKIFISWSDETSREIALVLGEWIPSVIQAVETYVSPEDIRKGTRWIYDVSKELNQSSLGILCVVPGNMGAPWLNFEAGVLSKSLDVSKVIPLLIDVEKSELDNGPLAQFPSAIFEKNEMYQILETINEKTEKGRLSKERLRNTFDIWWPKLKLDIKSIRKKEIPEIQDADQPEKTPETEEPLKTPDTEEPVKTPEADEPEKTPEADKPEKTPEADKPKKTPEAEEPEKTPETEEPVKTPETKEPEKTPEADKPKKTPKRTVEAARKSEAITPQDPVKPAKPAAAKPAPEEIEIEMLIVLYDPPGYTPRTADAVGFKLDISAQKAREHLDKLERMNYVREHLYVGRSKEYSLAPKGREYLTKHDLLKKRRSK